MPLLLAAVATAVGLLFGSLPFTLMRSGWDSFALLLSGWVSFAVFIGVLVAMATASGLMARRHRLFVAAAALFTAQAGMLVLLVSTSPGGALVNQPVVGLLPQLTGAAATVCFLAGMAVVARDQATLRAGFTVVAVVSALVALPSLGLALLLGLDVSLPSGPGSGLQLALITTLNLTATASVLAQVATVALLVMAWRAGVRTTAAEPSGVAAPA